MGKRVSNAHFSGCFFFVGAVRVAATIRDQLEYPVDPQLARIYTATFFSPVAGTIYFREVPGSEAGVQIYGKLYHTTDSATTEQHNWHVHENAVGWVTNFLAEEHRYYCIWANWLHIVTITMYSSSYHLEFAHIIV